MEELARTLGLPVEAVEALEDAAGRPDAVRLLTAFHPVWTLACADAGANLAAFRAACRGQTPPTLPAPVGAAFARLRRLLEATVHLGHRARLLAVVEEVERLVDRGGAA